MGVWGECRMLQRGVAAVIAESTFCEDEFRENTSALSRVSGHIRESRCLYGSDGDDGVRSYAIEINSWSSLEISCYLWY